MSNIMTNTGAMVALQSLKATNKNLAQVQSEISTGLRVENSKTNAAVWSISKIMDSDYRGFKGIQDSLNLGQSTVSVARQAAESIVERLNTIKEQIVSAQTANVDRNKIQAAISAEVAQIENTVKTAQFSGMNLINGSITSPGGGSSPTVSFLSSLDRDASGKVTASKIDVTTYNLGTNAGTTTPKSAFSISDGGSTPVYTDHAEYAFLLDGTNQSQSFQLASGLTFAAGDTYTITLGDQKAQYTVTEADVAATSSASSDANLSVLAGLKNAIDALEIEGLAVITVGGTTPGLEMEFTPPAAGNTLAITMKAASAGEDVGALNGLKSLNVRTSSGAASALSNIDGMIQTAIDAAAALGASESRISSQSEFVGKLSDSLRAGIGSLIEADMEEASARLQALQVQQQLGVQALSIANQAPQALLSLFR